MPVSLSSPPRSRRLRACLLTLALAAASLPATARSPYPGVLQIAVDATDLDHKVFRVRETLPVTAGRLTLAYPQWLPGTHGPTGSVVQLAGLQMRAAGATTDLPWRRDTLDANAFHLTVPAGVTQLDLEFEFLSPVDARAGRVQMTPDLLSLQWNQLLLYPAGRAAADVRAQASVTLPDGWRQASALGVASQAGSSVVFEPVDLNTLVDSPLIAGRNFRRIDLDPGAAAAGRPPVFLDIVADDASQAQPKPEQIAAHQALVVQADKLFASRHYAHYDFLLTVSDTLGGIGLEHHQSSEDGVRTRYFLDWDKTSLGRDLLPHEYTHSWNGKFRRPADLTTPNFNVPMQGSLLWMYEGQTQFWGHVLAARAGLVSPGDARDSLALAAASLDARSGRRWRDLQDTTNEPAMSARRQVKTWGDLQRGSDYYDEMRLVWLEADMLIRRESQQRRSLDDFAREFFGAGPNSAGPNSAGPNGVASVATYTFDDVVRALDRVQPHDWASFLRERLDSHGPGAPLGGLALAGWRLAWSDKSSESYKAQETRAEGADFSYSIGLAVGAESRLASVAWDGPAYRAGATSGATLVAVNGRAYTADRLRAAITAAHAPTDAAGKSSAAPIRLLLKTGDLYREVSVDYTGGLRYPSLERIPGTDDLLGSLFKPL